MTETTSLNSIPGPALQLARETLGATQKELADALGIARASVTGWERPHEQVPGKRVTAIEELLGAHRVRWACDRVAGRTTLSWNEAIQAAVDSERRASDVASDRPADVKGFRDSFTASGLRPLDPDEYVFFQTPDEERREDERRSTVAQSLARATVDELLAELKRRTRG